MGLCLSPPPPLFLSLFYSSLFSFPLFSLPFLLPPLFSLLSLPPSLLPLCSNFSFPSCLGETDLERPTPQDQPLVVKPWAPSPLPELSSPPPLGKTRHYYGAFCAFTALPALKRCLLFSMHMCVHMCVNVTETQFQFHPVWPLASAH